MRAETRKGHDRKHGIADLSTHGRRFIEMVLIGYASVLGWHFMTSDFLLSDFYTPWRHVAPLYVWGAALFFSAFGHAAALVINGHSPTFSSLVRAVTCLVHGGIYASFAAFYISLGAVIGATNSITMMLFVFAVGSGVVARLKEHRQCPQRS